MTFPNEYSVSTTKLTGDLNYEGNQALDLIREKGFEVHLGLTPEYSDLIATMALEDDIKEYCPRDCAERFANREATAKWLAKGRAAFLLMKSFENGELQMVGYGWA